MDPRLCYRLVAGASFCQHWPVRLQVYESEYTLLEGHRDHYRSSCRCGLSLDKDKETAWEQYHSPFVTGQSHLTVLTKRDASKNGTQYPFSYPQASCRWQGSLLRVDTPSVTVLVQLSGTFYFSSRSVLSTLWSTSLQERMVLLSISPKFSSCLKTKEARPEAVYYWVKVKVKRLRASGNKQYHGRSCRLSAHLA